MFKFQFLLSTFQNLLLNSVLTYQTNHLHLSVGREREREGEGEGGGGRWLGERERRWGEGEEHDVMWEGINVCMYHWVGM